MSNVTPTANARCAEFARRGMEQARTLVKHGRLSYRVGANAEWMESEVIKYANRIIALRTAEQPLWREFTDERGIVVCVPTNALLP